MSCDWRSADSCLHSHSEAYKCQSSVVFGAKTAQDKEDKDDKVDKDDRMTRMIGSMNISSVCER